MEPAASPPDPESIADELSRLQAKLAAAEDEDIRAALQLRIDALRPAAADEASPEPTVKRANLEAQRLAMRDEGPVDDVHIFWQETVRPAGVAETPPDVLQRAEQLVREARVQKMRGQKQAANDLLRQAMDAAPNAPSVLQAVADDFYESGQTGAAVDAYRRLKAIDPTNIVAERRIGELSLRSSPGSIDEQLLRMSDGGLIHAEDALASPKVATLISIFVPGGGQLALGQTVKGLAIMGVWALCVFFIFLMRQDVEALIRTSSGGGRVNYLVILPILTAFVLHISSIMGCASAAKRHERRTFDRPRPPMDLPFE